MLKVRYIHLLLALLHIPIFDRFWCHNATSLPSSCDWMQKSVRVLQGLILIFVIRKGLIQSIGFLVLYWTHQSMLVFAMQYSSFDFIASRHFVLDASIVFIDDYFIASLRRSNLSLIPIVQTISWCEAPNQMRGILSYWYFVPCIQCSKPVFLLCHFGFFFSLSRYALEREERDERERGLFLIHFVLLPLIWEPFLLLLIVSGTRYGASLRKQIKKMEVSQHSKYFCEFCGKVCAFSDLSFRILCLEISYSYPKPTIKIIIWLVMLMPSVQGWIKW